MAKVTGFLLLFRERIKMKNIKKGIKDYYYSKVVDIVDHESTRHYHHAFELYYMKDGACNYFIGDHSYRVLPGDVVIIPEETIPTICPRSSSLLKSPARGNMICPEIVTIPMLNKDRDNIMKEGDNAHEINAITDNAITMHHTMLFFAASKSVILSKRFISLRPPFPSIF